MKYIYWDSNCFIGFLKGEEHGKDAILGVLHAVERGEAKLVTSAFTLVEVVKLKENPNRTETSQSKSQRVEIEKCFGPDNGVIIVNVDIETASKAREAVWDYGVDPKDAMHVGTALRFKEIYLNKGDEIVFQTFDKKLIKHADGCGGIRFEEPDVANYPYQMSADL